MWLILKLGITKPVIIQFLIVKIEPLKAVKILMEASTVNAGGDTRQQLFKLRRIISVQESVIQVFKGVVDKKITLHFKTVSNKGPCLTYQDMSYTE